MTLNFGNMRTSFETYRSSAPAPAVDALTLPAHPTHELMSGAWHRAVGGDIIIHHRVIRDASSTSASFGITCTSEFIMVIHTKLPPPGPGSG